MLSSKLASFKGESCKYTRTTQRRRFPFSPEPVVKNKRCQPRRVASTAGGVPPCCRRTQTPELSETEPARPAKTAQKQRSGSGATPSSTPTGPLPSAATANRDLAASPSRAIRGAPQLPVFQAKFLRRQGTRVLRRSAGSTASSTADAQPRLPFPRAPRASVHRR